MVCIVTVIRGYNETEALLLTHHQGEQWAASKCECYFYQQVVK